MTTTKKMIEEVKRDLVEPDPNQPRKYFDDAKLIELGTDIAINGILQAVVVRPHPTSKGRYMIIFGERRWRAAGPGYAELETVPVVVYADVNDAQALEWQMAENGKRDDMHPLEEADGYRVMHERDGRDVEEIAEISGKSTAYVYASMKLCALTAEPRRAFLAGKFDKSIALLVARLPSSQQAPATKAILNDGEWDDDGQQPMSFREAKRYIRDEFMLRLVDAPFQVNDATLSEKAGACTTCPKRTGNQRELFADVVEDKRGGGADVCTDSTCYKEKLDVHWKRLAASAKEKGQVVLEGKEGAQAGGYSDKKHIDLDAPANALGEYNKSYRQVLGKHAESAVVALARDGEGQIKELVDKSALPKLLKEAGLKAKKEPSGGGKSQADYDREAREQKQLEAAVTQAAREAVLGKLDAAGDDKLWQLIARMAVKVARSDAQREIMKIHEVKVEGESHYSYGQRTALLAYVEKLPVRAARDLAVELLLAEAGGWRDEKAGPYVDDKEEAEERREYMTGLEHAGELLAVDLVAIADKARKDVADAKKQKAEKKAKPATEKKAKPAAKKKPAAAPHTNGVAPAVEATS